MTENNNSKPTEEPKSSDDNQLKLRDISKEELEQILEDHKKWVESDEKEGKRANLERANLPKANLYRVNLQRAYLIDANLQGAYLIDANLQQAYLWGVILQMGNLTRANLQRANIGLANLQNTVFSKANLQEANLYRCDLQKAHFYETDLQNAKLTDANLLEANFYGANLQNAILYKSKMQKTSLEKVNGLAKANLKDANFEGATGLLGDEFAQADVTGTKLPEDIKEFKALEIIEKTSENARKIFLAMLLGCVYSWLTIATTTDVRLLTNTASSPLPIIGTEIPIAWFYIAAPLVLICLYFYFHFYLDNLWKGLASLPAIFPDGKPLDQRAYPWLLNSLVRMHFKRLKKRSFIARMKEWITIFLAWWVVPITMMAFWLRYIPRKDWMGTNLHIGLIVVSVAFAIYFYRLCALTLQRKKKTAFRLQDFWREKRFYSSVIVVVVGILFSILSCGAIEGIKSEKPYPIEIKLLVPLVFKNFHFDVFADFREKTVSERPANFFEISKEDRLESVKGANLRNRNLQFADMSKAFLIKADLREALLENAILSETNFQRAYLQGAVLNNADLRKAYLGEANLQKAILKKADLKGAFLGDANLQGANLEGTNLLEGNFHSTDLTGAVNLTIEQLSKVKTLYKTKLDPELMKKVKKCCRHLLVEPKD